ncbi:TM0996/MTH895 family glutaredoxin-like protein [Candidatus Dependentiae bacterium]|nr:TM0996/MTH895 family glutaredoxin-like protein [Candidatus Dependentiae bacterium]
MKIEVLGTGCAKCKTLFNAAQDVVKESGLACEIDKVEDITKIMGYGVMMTPALVVDGEVKVAGRIPSKDEIKKWIKP